MSLVEINWQPSRKDLRNFGLIALIAAGLIAALLYVVKGLAVRWILPIAAFGPVVFLISRISLKLTRIIYLGLILITLPIGLLVSFIMLAGFYFLLITPLSLFFRLWGRDPLKRKFDFKAKSYWLTNRPPDRLERYFHQF